MVHHHPRIIRAVVMALALSAVTAPAALARFDSPPATTSTPADTSLCSEVCSASGYVSTSPTLTTTANSGPRSEVVSGNGYGSTTAPPTVVRVVAPGSGFDWGDAGIGAAAALVLTVLLFGGGIAATNSRRRATPSSVQPIT